jgi:DNA recombination protein RmuC
MVNNFFFFTAGASFGVLCAWIWLREFLCKRLQQDLHDTKVELARIEERLSSLDESRNIWQQEFKSIAHEIFEEKNKRINDSQDANLKSILEPLKENISSFRSKVEEVYSVEMRDRVALTEQVRLLWELNQTLSAEAKNLTEALRGSVKTQGSWGELVLERVLEASGLRLNEEYVVQDSHYQSSEDQEERGLRSQLDVVIKLPEGRSIIVDAKVSLLAYQEYATCEDEQVRNRAKLRHVESIRNHIKGLSSKDYQKLHSLKSLDFVLLFIPIESAFLTAIGHDKELFSTAWEKNVLLVSPSTLLFVVRTVCHLWKQEAQSRNAKQIAIKGGELYDKFVNFVDEFQKIGVRLDHARASYDDAFKKLSNGKGNLIKRIEVLRELGVNPSKNLNKELLESALDNSLSD